MFYVSGTKIYLDTFDDKLKVYPEVKLVKNDDDSIAMEIQKTGVAKKPANRKICSAREVYAMLGPMAQPKLKLEGSK